MNNEQMSYFDKAVGQAIADGKIITISDAAKYGAAWQENANAVEIAELINLLKDCKAAMGQEEKNVLGWQRKIWRTVCQTLEKYGL